MESTASEIAAYLDGMIREEVLAQIFRFRERWEPRVTGLLCNASDAALHRLRPVLSEYCLTTDQARHLPAVKVAIAQIVSRAAEQQIVRAQVMLRKMVNYEANRFLEALTLGGIAGQAGAVDLEQWEDRELADHLVGGDALQKAAAKSALLFIDRVKEVFEAATEQTVTSSALDTRLDQAAQWWWGRLGTIARTTVHAAANRVKNTLASGLR